MARLPIHPPSKAPPKKKAALVETPVLPPRSLETTVHVLKQQALALEMATEGHTHREIATALGVHPSTVSGLLTEALGELSEKRDKAVDKFFAMHRRRYELLIREWLPKSRDRYVELKNEDGALVEHFIPADPKAAMIMAKLQADYAKMFGLTKLRVEHTGAHGGPILNMNANFDWSRATDEQLAQAAAGNAEVIRHLSGTDPSGSNPRDASSGEGEDGPSSGRH